MDSEELNIAVANEAFAENKVYMLEKQLKQANEHLNESNKIIRQQQLLDEENLMLKNRIKQLEVALEATAMIIGPPGHSEWATDDEINRAWGLYIQTKEIKP